MDSRYLRIHGDNIVECERTLTLLSRSFNHDATLISNSLYMPKYEICLGPSKFTIDLLPGHNRWNIDIASELIKNGGVLREGADSYVTEVIDKEEHILFAIEYCSALPAGNNAWQRSGRAYSCALAGIPYFYCAEIGGVELDEERTIKAPRFPNPVVPFSYLMLTEMSGCFCMPIYLSHPAISPELYEHFKDVMGYDDCLKIIYGIIFRLETIESKVSLRNKALRLVQLLSSGRRSKDTLRGEEWQSLLQADSAVQWLIENTKDLIWKKKTADKVPVSMRFKELLRTAINLNCLTIGAKDIPICIIPPDKKQSMIEKLQELYPKIKFNLNADKPLAIVWITGFKPRGDDSRPDRGLTPLARMILGDRAEILSIVYGRAEPQTYRAFQASPTKLAKDNGLWQSIIYVADCVLFDTAKFSEALFFRLNRRAEFASGKTVKFAFTDPKVEFGEHDVDSAIHHLFCRRESMSIHECLCNPPGGDWSGISHFNSLGSVFRWTSLPRVSKTGGKRPDHVIQIIGAERDTLLAIESKKKGKDLDENIGVKLNTYISDLLKTSPTAMKNDTVGWRLFKEGDVVLRPYSIISVGAFVYTNTNELKIEQERGKLDIVMAFEFGKNTTIHIRANQESLFVVEIIRQILGHIDGVKIQIY